MARATWNPMSEPLSAPLAKKLLLIGWDAADWQLMHPLIDSGRMPHLKRLVEHGTIGNLQTLQPVLSPILWTSIATGKRAYLHGVHGFVEPTPDGTALRPTASSTRTCKALWNILAQSGKRCLALYLPGSCRGRACSNWNPGSCRALTGGHC